MKKRIRIRIKLTPPQWKLNYQANRKHFTQEPIAVLPEKEKENGKGNMGNI
jgi:hypothetical protein